MLYCIESMGRGYRDSDETYELFKNVLIDYVPFLKDKDELKLNDPHQEYFKALEEAYSYRIDDEERQNEDKMADSLAFYKASGLIKLKDGVYYVDSKKLMNKFLEYRKYEENKANMNSQVYKKGPRK